MSKGGLSSLKVKVVFIFFSFLFVFLVSELIYMLNSKPPYYREFMRKYHYSRVISSLQKSDAPKALYHFGRAAEIQLQDTTLVHPQKDWETSFRFPRLSSDSSFSRDVFEILGIYEKEEMYELQFVDLARIYYLLGLSVYETGEVQYVVPFWEAAIAFAPEWSYFHIELANYYLTLSDTKNTEIILERCLKFQFAKSYCKQYIRSFLNDRLSERIGFLKNNIVDEI